VYYFLHQFTVVNIQTESAVLVVNQGHVVAMTLYPVLDLSSAFDTVDDHVTLLSLLSQRNWLAITKDATTSTAET